MLRSALFICAVVSASFCDERRIHKHVDPFTALDRHLSHTLAYHYLWPWSQLAKAAGVLEADDSSEEAQIVSDVNKFEVNLNVKRYKPEELRIKVKNRNIIVEGKHLEKTDRRHHISNHFVQRFALPAGSKSEEVTAVFKPNGVLTISVPRHELPPQPPERDVPIEVIVPEDQTEKVDVVENQSATEKPDDKETATEKLIEKEIEPVNTEDHKDEYIVGLGVTPLESGVPEVTTHSGKIRKKELKDSANSSNNDVTKGVEGNGLDYALIESE